MGYGEYCVVILFPKADTIPRPKTREKNVGFYKRKKMELMNLLSGVEIALQGPTFEIALNWIGKLIRWLISGVGSVGVGIILFSLALKVIVLPFDVYQRISMRKQNQKMKENQDRMEKLQKQYANDKDMYNQKVMEMYKESGFSMFSSCLPLILSMVIFIVAINAFNAYAQYANVENYNMMVDAYNKNVTSYAPDLDSQTLDISSDGSVIYVKDTAEDKYIYYTVAHKDDYDNAYIQNANKKYYIDSEKALANADIKAYYDAKIAEGMESDVAIRAYFYDNAQTAVKTAYETEVNQKTKFLWIKNIWATDASYKHPVLEYADFSAEITREKFTVAGEKVALAELNTNVYGADAYNHITAKLDVQKDQANGYFILIVLSIGTILLQQFVSMHSQKEQQKYSSVDGQGASQQKMMMVIMTIMFGVFSFMYSAAFSIYMIMSNVLSLFSTLIINFFVDRSKDKKEQEQEYKKLSGRASRTAGMKNNKK